METVSTHIVSEIMWSDLATFLDEQCKDRGLSWREASLKAGLDHAAISRFIRGTVPSPESCRKLADFFAVPEDVVLSLAGHKTNIPDLDLRAQAIREAEHLLKQLPPEKQREVLEMIRAIHRLYTEQSAQKGELEETEKTS